MKWTHRRPAYRSGRVHGETEELDERLMKLAKGFQHARRRCALRRGLILRTKTAPWPGCFSSRRNRPIVSAAKTCTRRLMRSWKNGSRCITTGNIIVTLRGMQASQPRRIPYPPLHCFITFINRNFECPTPRLCAPRVVSVRSGGALPPLRTRRSFVLRRMIFSHRRGRARTCGNISGRFRAG